MINPRPSDYTQESSPLAGDDAVISGFTEKNICGTGATCLVYQLNLQGMRMAVKRLRREYLNNPLYIAAYRKEYNLGMHLKHDAIPVYRNLKEDIDDVYIVMDFIDGVSLSDFIASEEGKLFFRSPDNTRRFLSELVDVTGYLHRKGIIHCDLKPENIMIRHSDRRLMLIDLDKAYCDILDRTSGGTSGFSDPLKSGEKPTVFKDYAAIGKILEYLKNNLPEFPYTQFVRFRRQCFDPETNFEKINAAIHPHHSALFWSAAVLLCLALLIGAGYYISRNKAATGDKKIPEMQQMDAVADKEVTFTATETIEKTNIPNEKNEIGLLPAEKPRIIISNFDSRMSEFIQCAQTSFATLFSGTATDTQIRDMLGKMVESYTSEYHKLSNEYKASYPEVTGIDVELAVAKAAEKSNANHLLKQFSEAARDTLLARHPLSRTAEE